MGFKKINQDELKTIIGPNFLGMPIREVGKVIQTSKREKKIESSALGSIAEILILNEEFLEYQYHSDGNRKSLAGYGNIVIFNNSLKDRIWDSLLKFSGTQFDNQNSEKGMSLGIFEPNSNKILKYEIINSETLPNLVKVEENIENLSQDIKITKNSDSELDLGEDYTINEKLLKNHILLLGKENKVKFSILIENISTFTLENVNLKKYFSNKFYDLEIESAKSNDFKIIGNSIECPVNNLNPGEKIEVTFLANIFPKKKENIRSGKIDMSFNLRKQTISNVEIKHFSAYSHAMHAIRKTEKDHTPNHWQCSLVFENHSDFKMKIKSILVLDKSKKNRLLDLNFSASGKAVTILPRESYKTEDFDYKDEKEPTFSRKVEYSVGYNVEKNSMITVHFDDDEFKVANILIKKEISKREIKSFEESKINTKVVIKNRSTIPIKGIIAQVKIPEDFLPPRNITDYSLLNSAGELKPEDMIVRINPDDDDPSHEHLLELSINLKNSYDKALILEDDFLEVRYSLNAVTPDYKKTYDFPLEVNSYYSKYLDSNQKEYYVITDNLAEMDKSSIKVTHKRRKLMIGKEIFPGRVNNEFAIYITAKNGSNIKLNDVNITDTFPDSFELISSSIDHKLSKPSKTGERKISFTIDSLQPYQAREIMYYLKSISGKDVNFSELESFFIG